MCNIKEVFNRFTGEHIDPTTKQGAIKTIEYMLQAEPYFGSNECVALRVAIKCIQESIDREDDRK